MMGAIFAVREKIDRQLSCPLKNAIVAFFKPRQARSQAPCGSQNNDLRRYFVIASMRCRSLLSKTTGR
jgi:hypothetical protein